MEELEVTERNFIGITSDNPSFRIDSQFYSKPALVVEAVLRKRTHGQLKDYTEKIESFGAYALTNQFSYVEDGIPFLRCQNVKNGFTNFSDVLYINKDANKLLRKSEVKPGMVLLTMSGSVGQAAVALPSWKYPINSNQDIAKITPDSDLNPYYLSAFLHTRYGQVQMERLPVGSVQQHIFLWMIERLLISRFSSSFEKKITNVVQMSYQLDESVTSLQSQTDAKLIAALDLTDWQPPEPLTYSSQSSLAFAAGRLDAEYYQPKYDDLFRLLKQNSIYWRQVKDICAMNGRGVNPDYDETGTLNVINSQHILEYGLAYDNFQSTQEKNWQLQSKAQIQQYDILTYSTGANVGRTATYLESDRALAGLDVNILRLSAENPIYVGFVMNSLIGRMQTTRLLTGSAQAHLYSSDIDQFIIPFIDQNAQQEIIHSVLTAHTARKTAKALLEAAKRAVEIAIEDSETAAVTWLQEESTRLGITL